MARHLFDQTRLTRQLTIARSFAAAEKADRKAWRSMSPRQRLAALELWRQMNHARYDPDSARLPRVFAIVESASR
jgi:hypothetical protein